MNRIVGYVLLSYCVFVFSGCKPKIVDKDNPLYQSGESAAMQQQHTAEAFGNMVLLFNTLESSPSLYGLPGASLELQTVSRLNKWIEYRERDKFWKNDPYYADLSSAFTAKAQKLQRVLDMLQQLRQEDGNAVNSVDIAELTVALKELLQVLDDLSARSGMDFSEELPVIQDLAERFSRVRNPLEAAVLAAADQIKMETDQLSLLQRTLASFAELFKIDAFVFHNADADHFKKSIWMRNIANWVNRTKQDPLERAIALFNWTIRNIDLRADVVFLPSGQTVFTPPQEPWQTILLGHGTVADRAWVFVELLSQQRIDAALLCIPSETANEEQSDSLIPWAVGVLIDDNVHLFLPDYGLAVPGPQGIQLRLFADSPKTGELEYLDVATLTQVAENDSLLRQLDLEGTPFPLHADKVKESIALIVGTPSSASERMSLIQKELSGEETVLLYQSFQDMSDRFSKISFIKDVQHWKYPLTALYERQAHPERIDGMMIPFRFVDPITTHWSLWSGRILYFLGNHSGPESAITYFQEAKMPDRRYQELILSQAFVMTPETQAIFTLAKLYAHYWLGLIALETGRPGLAQEYFEELIRNPLLGSGQFWTYALAYNLGRAYEQQGDYERAITQYRRYVRAPGFHGNALRSQWIAQLRQVEEPVIETVLPVEETLVTEKPDHQSEGGNSSEEMPASEPTVEEINSPEN